MNYIKNISEYSMQTSIVEYFDLNSILEQLGYKDNHQRQILSLLWDMQEHSSDSVAAAGGKQYNARILELRRKGWNIISLRKGKVCFNFKLLSRQQTW